MVRYGFIREKDDIKFLVLFAMDLLPFPVDFATIVDLATWCDDGFGYFELSEAFYELLPSGHIEESVEGKTTVYQITQKGHDAIHVIEKQLPFAVREAAQRSAIRVVRQIRRDAAIHTSVTKVEHNDLVVRMEMDQVFAVEMNVVNDAQAAILDKTFKANAEEIYQLLLSALTANYESEGSARE